MPPRIDFYYDLLRVILFSCPLQALRLIRPSITVEVPLNIIPSIVILVSFPLFSGLCSLFPHLPSSSDLITHPLVYLYTLIYLHVEGMPDPNLKILARAYICAEFAFRFSKGLFDLLAKRFVKSSVPAHIAAENDRHSDDGTLDLESREERAIECDDGVLHENPQNVVEGFRLAPKFVEKP